MRLPRSLALLLLAGLLAAPAPAQETVAGPLPLFASWKQRTAFVIGPPAADDVALLGYANPATVARLEQAETLWWKRGGNDGGAPDWGLYSALPHVGLAVVHGADAWRDREIRLSLAGGDRRAAVGASWSWIRGDAEPTWSLGGLWQPRRWLSTGLTWTATRDRAVGELAGHLAWRPFDAPWLTLGVEGARARGRFDDLPRRPRIDDDHWRLGAAVEPLPGLRLAGDIDDDRTLRLGLTVDWGGAGGRTALSVDRDDNAGSAYGVRLGAHRGDVSAPLTRSPDMLQIDLHGPVRHRAYSLFDEGRSLLDLLTDLRRVETDPDLAGVALNLSGLRLDPSMSWELRQRLTRLRAAGRTVVVYIDRVDFRAYHLASAADAIVLDPAGLLVLEGLSAGQVYLTGALDKLGIGTQEWRYHEYKSAFESLTRTDMSPEDRAQWQALLDDDYGRARHDIADSRGLAVEEVDRLVDEVTALRPADALAAGLVDSLGRWDAVEALVTAAGSRLRTSLPARPAPRDWGEPPTIAVVYALGSCAMDSGIRARELSAELRRLAKDDGVAAVVLRVDSPGGDVLASDIVAAALAEVRAARPVVVSQARLAASGGYWISLDSDVIVATPATITGSIGVIGGWLYNDGFRQRLGVDIDHVQVGRHADLGLGLPLPLIGQPLPERPLTEEEVARTDAILGGIYDDFVGKVAEARGRQADDIDALARGRVWSGGAALEHGLVDTLGGLETALGIARQRAGVEAGRPVHLTQWPRLPWFRFGGLTPWAAAPAAATEAVEASWTEWLRFRLAHNGQALVALPQPFLEQLDDER